MFFHKLEGLQQSFVSLNLEAVDYEADFQSLQESGVIFEGLPRDEPYRQIVDRRDLWRNRSYRIEFNRTGNSGAES